jgi:CheY-like chemotaxis protein
MDKLLTGRSILIVEDEPLIALDIVETLRRVGASTFTAHTLTEGLRFAGHPDLSAAVVDFGLKDGDGEALCKQLNDRGIPFVLHSGYAHVHEACKAGLVLPKPATSDQLIRALESVLAK